MNPDFRALFPGAQQQVYLNIAAKGLTPTTVRDVVSAYMDDCVAGTSNKDVLRASELREYERALAIYRRIAEHARD